MITQSVLWLGYGLDDLEFDFLRGRRSVSLPKRPDLLGPTQPPIEGVSGLLSAGVKWQVPMGDHLTPSSAEFKNEWSCTSIPVMYLHGVDMDKYFLPLQAYSRATCAYREGANTHTAWRGGLPPVIQYGEPADTKHKQRAVGRRW